VTDDGAQSRLLEAAFNRFQQGASSPLQLYRELFDTVRPVGIAPAFWIIKTAELFR
jgi:hypothetical protein